MAKKKPCHVLFSHSDPSILWQSRKPKLPEITFELTERCNNNCQHCCINQPENDIPSLSREMTTELCKDLLRQAASLGAITVRFTGGEPLLRKDFVDLYLFARRLGLKVLIFTNARLITSELADLFARVPPIEKIEITDYGVNQDSYESITQKKDSFLEYQHGLEKLIEKKIPFYVKGTLLPSTRHQLAEYMSWSARLPWVDPSPSFVMFLELRHRRDSATKNRQISSLRMSPEAGIKILAENLEVYRKGMSIFFKTFWAQPTEHLFNCDGKACIDSYGKIQFCLALRHPDTILDVQRYSLEYAVKEFWPHLRKKCASNREFLARCARCFLRVICQNCPAKSWTEYGSLDQPVEYWCQIAHEEARVLGLVANNEHAWEVTDWRDRATRFAVNGY